MNLLHSEVRFEIRWWAALRLVWFVLAKPATILCLLTERDRSTHVKTFDLVLVLLMEKWEEPQQTWGKRWEEGKDGINQSDPEGGQASTCLWLPSLEECWEQGASLTVPRHCVENLVRTNFTVLGFE